LKPTTEILFTVALLQHKVR